MATHEIWWDLECVIREVESCIGLALMCPPRRTFLGFPSVNVHGVAF